MQVMLAETITKTKLVPGMVILRGGRHKLRCLIASHANRFGQVLYITERDLLTPAWMGVKGTRWIIADKQMLEGVEPEALLAIRLLLAHSRLRRRIQAKYGAFVDVRNSTGLNHDGGEYPMSHVTFVDCEPEYQQHMARIRWLLDDAMCLREVVKRSA